MLMERDIDQMTFDLIKTMSENQAGINKALPPKLKYRIRHWLRGLVGRGVSEQRAKQFIAQKFEEEVAVRNLAKNETLASFYEDQVVKFDFGSEVSAEAKKKAIAWAKKRGLRPVEASLAKSSASSSQVVVAPANAKMDPLAICVRRIRFKDE
jgi:hypothetical protein